MVSIIIPVHDRFALATRAIRAASQQSYRPLQIVVVDDGSAEPFGHSDVLPAELSLTIKRFETAKGPGYAREVGRQMAVGDFVAYLDSDDYWPPRFLERMVSALKRAPEAGFAYCSALDVFDNKPTGVCKRSDRSFDSFLPHILKERPWPTSGCLWRRDTADKLGAWLPLWSWEDLEYDCRAGCMGVGLTHVKEPLCYVQRDAPSRLSTANKTRRTLASKTAALSGMVRAIRSSSWVRHVEVRRRLSGHAFATAIAAAESGMKSIASASLAIGWEFGPRRLESLPFVLACKAMWVNQPLQNSAKLMIYAHSVCHYGLPYRRLFARLYSKTASVIRSE